MPIIHNDDSYHQSLCHPHCSYITHLGVCSTSHFKPYSKLGMIFWVIKLRHLPPTDLEKAHERAALQQSQKQRLVSAPWRSQWCLGLWRLRRVVSSRVWRLTKNQETLQLKVQQLRPPGCLKIRSKQIAWKVPVEWHCMFLFCQIRFGGNMKSRKTTWFIEERVAGLLFLPSEGIDLRICSFKTLRQRCTLYTSASCFNPDPDLRPSWDLILK